MIKRVKKIIKLKNIKVLSRKLSDHFFLIFTIFVKQPWPKRGYKFNYVLLYCAIIFFQNNFSNERKIATISTHPTCQVHSLDPISH